ncbi:MAG: hypothetical protein QM796_15320 [Chthoniobacteraceae bacterium]
MIPLVVLVAVVIFRPAALAGDEPKMRAAIDLLREAKTSPQPVLVLQDARKQLQHAARNKKGWRVKGMGEVDEAIAEAKVGDHDKMVEKIDHAIADLWTGYTKGHGGN